MHDDDDDTEDFYPEDTLQAGDHLLLWTSDRGLEMGILVGITESGVLWRRTNRRVETEGPGGEPDWAFEELGKPVRIFSPWSSIERLESEEDVMEELELSEFRTLLGAVDDPGDFSALVEAATDEESD